MRVETEFVESAYSFRSNYEVHVQTLRQENDITAGGDNGA